MAVMFQESCCFAVTLVKEERCLQSRGCCGQQAGHIAVLSPEGARGGDRVLTINCQLLQPAAPCSSASEETGGGEDGRMLAPDS